METIYNGHKCRKFMSLRNAYDAITSEKNETSLKQIFTHIPCDPVLAGYAVVLWTTIFLR